MGPEISIKDKIYYQFASNNYLGLTIDSSVIKSSISSTIKYGDWNWWFEISYRYF